MGNCKNTQVSLFGRKASVSLKLSFKVFLQVELEGLFSCSHLGKFSDLSPTTLFANGNIYAYVHRHMPMRMRTFIETGNSPSEFIMLLCFFGFRNAF